ncbi:MAG: hypothetical protein ACFE8A_09680 [Candidatus Hodarchaeota archaeon]
MKKKLFLISFLLFATIIIGMTTNTVANDDDDEYYEVGFKEGVEFIYICKTIDEDGMIDIWGNHYEDYEIFEGIKEGAKMKWKITEIDDEDSMYSSKTKLYEDALTVKYDYWIWTDKAEFGGADYEDEQYSWFTNPEDYKSDLEFVVIFVPWIPYEVEMYLDALELYKWWYIDENILYYELDGKERLNWYDSDIHKKNILIEMEYNDEGIMSSFKILNEDEEVVLEFALENPLAYIIPIVLIVVAVIATLTIVYIVMRKKGIKLKDIKNKIRRKKTNEHFKE